MGQSGSAQLNDGKEDVCGEQTADMTHQTFAMQVSELGDHSVYKECSNQKGHGDNQRNRIKQVNFVTRCDGIRIFPEAQQWQNFFLFFESFNAVLCYREVTFCWCT